MSPAAGGASALLLVLLAGCAQAPPEAFERAKAMSLARGDSVATSAVADAAPRIRRPVVVSAAARHPMEATGRYAPPVLAATTPNVGTPEWEREKVQTERRERDVDRAVRGVCTSCLGPEPTIAANIMAMPAARIGAARGNNGSAAAPAPTAAATTGTTATVTASNTEPPRPRRRGPLVLDPVTLLPVLPAAVVRNGPLPAPPMALGVVR